MKLFDIKRGDILVIKVNNHEPCQFERDYIIFIASGSKLSISSGNGYICYSIPVMAAIDLSNTFNVGVGLSVGYTIYHIEKHKTSTIRKPTFSEMTELINRLKENGYIYNKKNKKY
jgi:hypothetical protein